MASEAAARLVKLCTEKKLRLATAESCTGGLIAAAITDVPGASAVFTHGFIPYANEAKTGQLGVAEGLIAAHGAVSGPVALAMAKGALARAKADASVAVTGIAGPTGGTKEKPVGTVFIACAAKSAAPRAQKHLFSGDRSRIRAQAVEKALEILYETALGL